MTLAEPGQDVQQVYFVESGMLSLVLSGSDGQSIEVGIIGREGVGGVGMALANRPTDIRIQVQVAGSALAMPSEALRSHVLRSAVLHQSLMRYLQAVYVQGALNAACNRK